MSDVFAKAGEAVTTPDRKVICYVKNDLRRYEFAKAEDFHDFADGETPWRHGEPYDLRCTRSDPDKPFGGLQICINGEWRP